MQSRDLIRLSNRLSTLQILLAWDLAVSKFKARQGVEPHAMIKLQLEESEQSPPVLYLPAPMLEPALKAYAQSLVTELEEAEVDLKEVVQRYLEAAENVSSSSGQENKKGVDNEDELM